ncbi:MAG: alpha/beta fold hydrolase [Anaerolineales bacterium]|nr:alpha/beta fold hydrolase [Anaerolineales bacterium]
MHGLPEGWYSWRYVLPLVDQNYRLIAIDMKGYGRSDLQDEDYNWHTVAGQIVDLMDSLGVEKYYVVSHDWGTIIGSVMVSDHPERILGYIRMEADLIQKRKSAQHHRLPFILKSRNGSCSKNNWIASYLYQDAGWLIDTIYPDRMTSTFKQIDRDYLVYEYSRPGVATMNPKYFLTSNWDLNTAIGKICKMIFLFQFCNSRQIVTPHNPNPFSQILPANVPTFNWNG